MAKILSVATHGTDDQTKCTFAFITAVGAPATGKVVSVALLGEAVYVGEGRGGQERSVESAFRPFLN